MTSPAKPAERASLAQELWLGTDPRLRGRRLAPFEEPGVRILFHPDLGACLDDVELAGFLETLAARVDVVCLEPRGHGGSGGRFGPEAVADLRGLVESAGRRWRDGLPLVVAGHGLGGALALAVADHPGVCGVAALAPTLPPLPEDLPLRETLERGGAGWAQVPALVDSLDLPRRSQALRVPLLLVTPRDARLTNQGAIAALAEAHAGTTVAVIPGNHLAPMAPPWGEVLAAWAIWAASGSPSR